MKYFRKYEGVDNKVKLKKSKFTPYYNVKVASNFDYNNFKNGDICLIQQHIRNEDIVGKKIVIFYVDFDLKTGDVVYIEPKVMEYRWIELPIGKYINLVSVEDGRMQSCNYWEDIKAFVWDYDDREEAVLRYNEKIGEMIKLREDFMIKKVTKELKDLKKLYSENLYEDEINV